MSQKITQSITIQANPEFVFHTMIGEQTYPIWTQPFNPTCRYEGSWEEGADILFLGQDNEGGVGGMVSRIARNIPNQYLSIEHLGIYKNGEKITEGDQAEEWKGFENYTLVQEGKNTILSLEMDSTPDFVDYFNETWPLALQKLKEICEKS